MGRIVFSLRGVAFATAALIACVEHTEATAQQLVYRPVNPSFGGNPFNSSHLLGIAAAINDFKDPNSSSSLTQGQQFANQLQSRLLSALSSQITDAIFGPNAQENGTVQFGSQTISWVRGLSDVTVTIFDSSDGSSTTIIVPFLNLGGN